MKSIAVRWIFLFDIDGTLLSTGGAGRYAMSRTFMCLHGIDNALEEMSLGGKTDPQIYDEAARRWNVAPRLEPFQELYFQTLAEELPRFNGRGHLMPGITPLLRYLAQRSDCLLGLLTGNWQEGARLKLKYFGIEDYFACGAFGDDAADRLELSGIARRRAEAAAGSLLDATATCLVIGDTPRDIACARTAACRAVAVATGDYSLSELMRHAPDHIFPSLADTGCFCQQVGLPAPLGLDFPNCDAFLRLCSR
ncbi:MAG: HAD hydrolase-like protein [Acidobacteria bacterium]|nr:HAD hydrolase-like protein [Acidobacteriota bacterium]